MMRLQWGRDVSIPEMRSIAVIKAVKCSASMGPGCFYPGNINSPVTFGVNDAASMGPGCFYPGNAIHRGNKSGEVLSFNGAGMFLSRKFGTCGLAGRKITGFNGAGMFLSRKWLAPQRETGAHRASMGPGCFYPGNASGRLPCRQAPMLQWGRDVSIPEMRGFSLIILRVGSASMGPGCFYPGNLLLEQRIARGGDASMGPGCFYPGNSNAEPLPSML